MEIENKFSIGEVCKILGCEQHNLRYIEKVLELNIERENNIERSYSYRDIEILKIVFELKEQGLNYKAIKKVLEKGEEINVNTPDIEVGRKEMTIINQTNYNEFMKNFQVSLEKMVEVAMTTAINNNLDECLSTKLEPLEEGLKNIQKENKELKSSLEEMQEKHFKEIDDKLLAWREKSIEQSRNRNFWHRLFNL
ncbi:helix-turn-helix domain-containing protein [Clostridium cavendishii]|nr:helix-turn-helix domain-containing protein [Clostridium cavendishii]